MYNLRDQYLENVDLIEEIDDKYDLLCDEILNKIRLILKDISTSEIRIYFEDIMPISELCDSELIIDEFLEDEAISLEKAIVDQVKYEISLNGNDVEIEIV